MTPSHHRSLSQEALRDSTYADGMQGTKAIAVTLLALSLTVLSTVVIIGMSL